MDWADTIATLLWRGSWAALPFVLLVAAVCKWTPSRPGTRHALWVIALGSFLTPLLSLFVPLPNLLPQRPAASAQAPAALSLAESPAAEVAPAHEEPEALTAEEEALLRDFFEELARVEELKSTTATVSTNSQNEVVFIPAYWTTRLPAQVSERSAAKTNQSVVAVDPAENAEGFETDASDVVDQATSEAAPVAGAFSSNEDSANSAPTFIEETPRDSWLAGIARVRDALADLPTLPVEFWLAGLVGMLLFYIVGALRFRGRMHRSGPAPRDVERMVERVSRRIGLKRSPETVMLAEPVSPLVWCGRRARLVLPAGLWGELDPAGRQAILYHELAHLRRRDHWVRRLELLLSALFWWNPLVWWIRRRVEEEADHCCDAWVTWLMPRRRRAYAEALLATREHINAGARRVPAIVMGATSPKAKCFARRIKMVMTQSSRPGLSVMGIGLALSLAIVGWIATPAWSCPNAAQDGPIVLKTTVSDKPEASEKAAICEKVEACKKVAVCTETATSENAGAYKIVAPGAKAGAYTSTVQCVPSAQGKTVGVAVGTDDKQPEIWVSASASEDDEPMTIMIDENGKREIKRSHRRVAGDSVEARLNKLEKAIEKLNKLLEKRDIEVVVPKAFTPPAAPAMPAMPAMPELPHGGTWIWKDGQLITPSGEDQGLSVAIEKAQEKQKTVAREYKLPKGKLEALTALMVREDVPVLVSPGENSITVHATPRQHKIFKAFIDLINPPAAGAKAEDEEDVKVMIGTLGDDDEIYCNVSGIKDLAGLRQYISGDDWHKAIKSYKNALKGSKGAVQCLPRIQGLKLDDSDGIVIELNEQLEQLDEQLERQISKYEKQAEQLEKQAEKLARQAEKLAEGQPEKAHALEKAMQELEFKAQQLEKMAEELELKAEQQEEDEQPEL